MLRGLAKLRFQPAVAIVHVTKLNRDFRKNNIKVVSELRRVTCSDRGGGLSAEGGPASGMATPAELRQAQRPAATSGAPAPLYLPSLRGQRAMC